MKSRKEIIDDSLTVLTKIGCSLAIVVAIIIGDHLVAWLIPITIGAGNPGIMENLPLSIARTVSICGVAIAWIVHVFVQLVLFLRSLYKG